MSDDRLPTIEERMAELASRIHDPDPRERRYASWMLDRLWQVLNARRGER